MRQSERFRFALHERAYARSSVGVPGIVQSGHLLTGGVG